MSYKLGFLAGAAAGYVFGARAGRTRFEQIKKQADAAWTHPKVQTTLADAADAVKAKTPPAAHGLVDKAVSAVVGEDGASTTGTSTHTNGTPSTVGSPTVAGASDTSSITDGPEYGTAGAAATPLGASGFDTTGHVGTEGSDTHGSGESGSSERPTLH